MMIRSRGEQYLHDFINNTQKLLPGTAMPRVGLTEAAQAKVVSYIDQVGDSKKKKENYRNLCNDILCNFKYFCYRLEAFCLV